MQIDNDVGTKAFIRTGHDLGEILFIHEAADDALLPMTIGNLVSNRRHAHGPQPNTNLKESIAIHHHSDFVNNKCFRIFANDNDGSIATDFSTRIIRSLVDATDEDVIVLDAGSLGGKTVLVNLGLIRLAANADAGSALWLIQRALKSFLVRPDFANDCLVHFLNRAATRATFDGTATPNDGIFLGETSLGCDGDHLIFAHGPLVDLASLGDNRIRHGSLGIPKNMKMVQIQSVLLVGRGSTDGLFDHTGLLGNARRLIVIRPGYCAARRPENGTGVHGHMRLG